MSVSVYRVSVDVWGCLQVSASVCSVSAGVCGCLRVSEGCLQVSVLAEYIGAAKYYLFTTIHYT